MRSAISSLLVLLLARSAEAAPRVEVAPDGDLAQLADTLRLAGSDEAAILLVAGLGLDRVELEWEGLDLAVPGAERHPPLLVRGLREGLVRIAVARADKTWEGQLRLFAGRITRLDVDAVLSGVRAPLPEAVGFDLFDFYDRLDAATNIDKKLGLCAEALPSIEDETMRRMAASACARIEQQGADARAERVAVDVDGPIDAPRGQRVPRYFLYRADGLPRRVPAGTAVRGALFGGALFGGGLATYAALYWEVQAQAEYLDYRDAQRLGDPVAMAETLFHTQQFDDRRDTAIGTAIAMFSAALSSALFQAAEDRRFARARLDGAAP